MELFVSFNYSCRAFFTLMLLVQARKKNSYQLSLPFLFSIAFHQVECNHTQHFSQEHSTSLKKRMSKAPRFAIRTFRRQHISPSGIEILLLVFSFGLIKIKYYRVESYLGMKVKSDTYFTEMVLMDPVTSISAARPR